MKNILLFSILVLSINLRSQTKIIDEKLVGTWKGFKSAKEKDNIDGVTKYWTTTLLKNGSGVISFISFNDQGAVEFLAHNLEWWTDNNKIYILYLTDMVTDSYEYMIKDNKVFYKSITVYKEEINTYTFYETKILNHK